MKNGANLATVRERERERERELHFSKINKSNNIIYQIREDSSKSLK